MTTPPVASTDKLWGGQSWLRPAESRPRAELPAPRGESGYAMLLVFLMAAIIAITLYRELPRIAFESQRAKEELLIERGEQYKRAIQLFVRKVNRYPATIEELESLNNIRFLRKRYVDPMTGKDKWRLIHVNGGVLTDSIIPKNKPGQPGQPGDQQPPANTNTFIGEGPVMGATPDQGQQQMNPAMRRRASDDRPVVTQEVAEVPQVPDTEENSDNNDSNNNNDNNNNDNADETPAQPVPPGVAVNNGSMPGANMPGMVPPNQQVPGMPPGRFPQPGMYPPNAYSNGAIPGQQGFNPATANMPNMPNTPYGSMPNQPAQNPNQASSGGFPAPSYPGQSASPTPTSGVYYPGQPNTAYPGAQSGFPGQQPGMMPGQQPGMMPGQMPSLQANFPGQQPGMMQPQQQALFQQQQQQFQPQQQPGQGITMNDLGLTSPRPGGLQGVQGMQGMQGVQGMQGMQGMGGTQMGGGIAGVASESKGPSIIVYHERKKYNEWEFVYDQSKDRGLAGVTRGGGAPGTPAGQMGSMPPGMNPQQPGGFGQQSPGGFGQQSPGGFGQQSPGGFGQQPGGFGQPSPGFGQQVPQPQPQPPQQQPPN